VEDVNDPFFFGRMRVRIFGIHNKDTNAVPTDTLPWCEPLMPLPNPFISGVGVSPTGMVNGNMVVLLPKDPDLLQEWIVLGSVGGLRKSPSTGGFRDPKGEYPRNTTNHDTNVLVRGKTGAQVDVLGEGSGGDGKMPSGYGPVADKVANRTTSEVQAPIDQGVPPPPPPETRTDTPWMPFAVQQVGVNETDNPDKIKEYHTKGGGSSTWGGEVPWCSSFANWVLLQASLKGTMLANARSWDKYGVDVLGDKTSIPYGAIVVIQGNRGPNSGHVCFATGVENGRVKVVGGNQGSKNAQNGGEVTNSSFPLSAVVAARMPPGFDKKG
jgi:uncharacterized protein (TIGR02594 family)